MNLKRIFNFSALFVGFILLLYSCNSDNTNTIYSSSSADAQIYDFALSAKPYTAADTIDYEILGETKFVINQTNQIIYNPDSLPYGIHITNFKAAITFASASPNAVYLTLKGVTDPDSIVTWNTTDSINFAILKNIEVVAQNATTKRLYTIDLRIHKIEPDTIIWTQKPSLSNSANSQKTLLKNNSFYCYALKGSALSLNVFDKTLNKWTPMTLVSPPSSIVLESITLFQDKCYAINTSGNAFRSNDGLTWTNLGNQNIISILGILPSSSADKDRLAVVVANGSSQYVATTTNMNSFQKASDITDSDISFHFPKTGFSWVTNYNRTSSALNQLIVTGGKGFDGVESNLTWLLRIDTNGNLQKIPSQSNTAYTAAAGIPTFLYDDFLYALATNKFYRSNSWGISWAEAPAKQTLASGMPKTNGQSVIIDSDNYIWVFGGKSGNPIEVWRGRLNKLNPKI